ncbi:MAG TPA: 2-oxoglutarate dehydrogenase complex dihydrolipoyllysine-residue succinyltransferase [Verrucomicrobiae bacterium]|nr:2-oxoglutarate dehydrogenase complex dihydrolipoyllysine-residue succinyltransferase [Verrucomicrobiae bacterium]
MRIDVTVPNVGESITEVEIGEWLKNKGDSVDKNEPLLTVESDKATVEIRAPESATLIDILKNSGDSAAVGEVIAHLEAKSGRAQTTATESRRPQPEAQPPRSNGADAPRGDGATSGSERIVQEVAPSELANKRENQAAEQPPKEETPPSARDVQIIEAKETTAQQVQDTESPEQPPEPSTGNGQPAEEQGESIFPGGTATSISQRDEAVRMTALRRLIAERLVQAQQSAALLTTFNEIDMSAVIALRQAQGEAFQEKHRIKLGFMSFFVKAAVIALQTVREVNAEIRGDEIIYHNYYDIGIAVGGGKGLVVPVLRNAETMSFADIERAIDDFARRAKESRLKPEELQGGTFTITNGGVYGSLLSTPIVNPPQSAILGLHAIQDRPVARGGAVAIRPMMYVALTYDHRLIDGREAVLFLKQIKNMIEEPARMLLQF